MKLSKFHLTRLLSFHQLVDRLADGGRQKWCANRLHVVIHQRRRQRSCAEQRRRFFLLVYFDIVQRLQQISLFPLVSAVKSIDILVPWAY